MATERLTDSNGKALHPTQKPVDVIARLLRIAPESVCDPFMGTGTTGIACIRMGIPFVGVERDPVHFDTARKRLERELAQGRLALDFNTDNKTISAKREGAPEREMAP
jgi:DNA modification methylase